MNKPYQRSNIGKIKNNLLSNVEKNRKDSVFKREKQWEELSTGPDCI